MSSSVSALLKFALTPVAGLLVIRSISLASRFLQLGAARTDLDVLQGIRRVAAADEDAAILAGLHEGHVGPDDRQRMPARQRGELVDVVHLPRIGLIGGDVFADIGVG